MADVDWSALRDQYQAGYDTGVAELRAAASRLRQSDDVIDDEELRTTLAELFAGLTDDAETTGPDPRALSVARTLAALAPRPALRQLEQARPVPEPRSAPDPAPGHRAPGGSGSGGPGVAEPVPVVASAVAHGRPATRADVVIARIAVAAASVWHRLRDRR